MSVIAGLPPAEAAAQVSCPECWSRPHEPCVNTGRAGSHLARYCRARRRGLLSAADIGRVFEGLDVIANWVVIP